MVKTLPLFGLSALLPSGVSGVAVPCPILRSCAIVNTFSLSHWKRYPFPVWNLKGAVELSVSGV